MPFNPSEKQSLDPTQLSSESQQFARSLAEKIIGQEEGVRSLADLYQVFSVGMCSPGRPVANLLFLGPTGTGKTRTVEAAAEILFGSSDAVIKVDCAEFQHSHEIAKLIGSPPGYLGHRETHPRITQEELEKHHTENLKLSFLLFDEIEKASDALWQLLLGIMDKATLTLGDNRRVDLSSVIVVLTSNLGGGEISELMDGRIGFVNARSEPAETLDPKVARAAQGAARRKFSPEFMNRLDEIVIFRPLQPAQLERILDLELDIIRQRLVQSGQGGFSIQVSPAARAYLLSEGTDLKYGARYLKRIIHQKIVLPLASFLGTSQLRAGDILRIDFEERPGRLVFEREANRQLLPLAAAAGK